MSAQAELDGNEYRVRAELAPGGRPREEVGIRVRET